MSKYANRLTVLRGLLIAIAAIQLFDIFIHAVTNQLEILRVASNIIILLWVASAVSERFKKIVSITAAAIGIYLILNIAFLSLKGITNAAQGGELRVMLFVLLFLTTILSTLFISLYSKHPFPQGEIP
ncbi:MAG: hypothetical protein H0T73_06230 [Ardenticatenales bacterium]|nr:hypothetical protein [Ardenticatenales bacterium]